MLPNSIKIGGSTWKISVVEGHIIEGAEGTAMPTKQLIQLSCELSESRQEEIFFHELLHALMDFTGLSSDLPDDWEEKVVNRLSPVLYMVLKENDLPLGS